MSVPTKCAVDGCDRQAARRGWCIAHYSRWQKSGDPGPAEVRKRAQVHPMVCGVSGCSAPYLASGYCQMHYDGFRRGRNDFKSDARNRRGAAHPNWSGGGIGYSALHMRLRAYRGDASKLSCAHCGGRAAQWAYDYADPSALRDENSGLVYSLDLARYMPLCVSCHKVFDLAHGQSG